MWNSGRVKPQFIQFNNTLISINRITYIHIENCDVKIFTEEHHVSVTYETKEKAVEKFIALGKIVNVIGSVMND